MVNSNTQRIEAIETSMAEVNQRMTSMEDSIQQMLAEGMAAFQKTLAENFAAKSVEDTQRNKESVEAATTRLEGRIDRYRGDQTAQMNILKESQEKFQTEMKLLLANRNHQGDGAHSENRRQFRRGYEEDQEYDDQGGGGGRHHNSGGGGRN